MTASDGDTWITVSQLRTHMHRVRREVERGQAFTVTRSGRIVARLIAVETIESVTPRPQVANPPFHCSPAAYLTSPIEPTNT